MIEGRIAGSESTPEDGSGRSNFASSEAVWQRFGHDAHGLSGRLPRLSQLLGCGTVGVRFFRHGLGWRWTVGHCGDRLQLTCGLDWLDGGISSPNLLGVQEVVEPLPAPAARRDENLPDARQSPQPHRVHMPQ